MRALVTGGGGFLGAAIVRRLVDRGWQVSSLARNRYPELDELGVRQFAGDLADPDAVSRAAEGCGIVYHVAAKAGVWGPEAEYYSANVVGTRNVLEACRRHHVRRLVYTSTPSVAHGGEDLEGVDESVPIPDRLAAAYPRTKAVAESEVLAANGNRLATVALRPHLIWGPGDNHLLPQMVARSRQGRLRLVNGGRKLVDSVYIDNAADAHLLAGDCLAGAAPCAGRAYFISQGEPITIAALINGMLEAVGQPPVTRSVSLPVALVAGAVLELAYRLLPLPGEPAMTRFLARQLATAHWYDISAARRDLGYHPRVSIADGFERLREWWLGRSSSAGGGRSLAVAP